MELKNKIFSIHTLYVCVALALIKTLISLRDYNNGGFSKLKVENNQPIHTGAPREKNNDDNNNNQHICTYLSQVLPCLVHCHALEAEVVVEVEKVRFVMAAGQDLLKEVRVYDGIPPDGVLSSKECEEVRVAMVKCLLLRVARVSRQVVAFLLLGV